MPAQPGEPSVTPYSSLIPDDDLTGASEALAFNELWFCSIDGYVTPQGSFKEKEGIKIGAGPDERRPA